MMLLGLSGGGHWGRKKVGWMQCWRRCAPCHLHLQPEICEGLEGSSFLINISTLQRLVYRGISKSQWRKKVGTWRKFLTRLRKELENR